MVTSQFSTFSADIHYDREPSDEELSLTRSTIHPFEAILLPDFWAALAESALDEKDFCNMRLVCKGLQQRTDSMWHLIKQKFHFKLKEDTVLFDKNHSIRPWLSKRLYNTGTLHMSINTCNDLFPELMKYYGRDLECHTVYLRQTGIMVRSPVLESLPSSTTILHIEVFFTYIARGAIDLPKNVRALHLVNTPTYFFAAKQLAALEALNVDLDTKYIRNFSSYIHAMYNEDEQFREEFKQNVSCITTYILRGQLYTTDYEMESVLNTIKLFCEELIPEMLRLNALKFVRYNFFPPSILKFSKEQTALSEIQFEGCKSLPKVNTWPINLQTLKIEDAYSMYAIKKCLVADDGSMPYHVTNFMGTTDGEIVYNREHFKF